MPEVFLLDIVYLHSLIHGVLQDTGSPEYVLNNL